MKAFSDAFSNLGVYAYVVAGVFVPGGIISIVGAAMNNNSQNKWPESHPGAAKLILKAENNVII